MSWKHKYSVFATAVKNLIGIVTMKVLNTI